MPDLIPETSEWWIARLWAQLDERTKRIKLYDDYYEGHQRLEFTTDQARETFAETFGGVALNFCELVIDAVEERLGIRGFRVSEGKEYDPEAAEIWRKNDMDAQSSMVHTEALCNEEGYLIVWVDEDRMTPVITAETPFEVIVERSGKSRLERLAAMKRWLDDERYWRVTLYLPHEIRRFRSRDPVRKNGTIMATHLRRDGYWEPWVTEGEEWPIPNPLGVVPVVPITNRPRLGYRFGGTSELKAAVPIQDIINKTVFDGLVASEFVAYPQRYMVGVSVPKDPITDQPIQPFKAGANRIWFVEKGDATSINPAIGQFPQADLMPYVARTEAHINQLAAITKTPKHYLVEASTGGSNLSSETVKALEAPLVAKTRRRQGVFGVGWAEVMAIALRLKAGGKYEPADADRIEVDWKDPETRTEAQHVDALVKLKTLGVPEEQLQRDYGYTEEQISRFRLMDDAEPVAPSAINEPVTSAILDTPFA